MELKDIMPRAELVIKELTEGINSDAADLEEAEKRILAFLYQVGQLMEQEVVNGIREPTGENAVVVCGREAVYAGKRDVSFRNRFGGQTVLARRCYKYRDGGGGGWVPLDEKLGLDRCLGYSTLMSYLVSSFGASDPYAEGAQHLSEALGFSVSATAVQRNTEAAGERLPESPHQQIDSRCQGESCELMVVEVDGTMSPQIVEREGVSGRESLKAPTEYKECNVAVIEKHFTDGQQQRWIGARYGPRREFEPYVARAGLAMGQHHAGRIAFIADGATNNWELQKTNFPAAVQILDFFHASEHVGQFCELLPNQKTAEARCHRWCTMLEQGQALQVVAEMRGAVDTMSKRSEGVKHINYFRANLSRMEYDRYRAEGLPIGSGLVEGSCKFVIGRRFKGNGMRWKKADNAHVLLARLAKLNGTLHAQFMPKPQKWLPKAAAA